MARVLAAKAAIGLRVDALQDWGEKEDEIPEDEKAALGLEARFNLERKLAAMEGKPLKPRGVAIAPNGVATAQPKKWEIKEARKYNPDADGLAGDEAPAIETVSATLAKKDKKKDKKRKLVEEVEEPEPEPKSETEDERMEDESTSPVVNGQTLNGAVDDSADSDDASENDEEEQPKSKLPKKQAGKPKERDISELAALAGLSLKRYKRKLERGEIRFEDDGTPVSISKKEIKKAKKAAAKAAAVEAVGEVNGSKKRKRVEHEEDAEAVSKSEKKKKKKKEKA